MAYRKRGRGSRILHGKKGKRLRKHPFASRGGIRI